MKLAARALVVLFLALLVGCGGGTTGSLDDTQTGNDAVSGDSESVEPADGVNPDSDARDGADTMHEEAGSDTPEEAEAVIPPDTAPPVVSFVAPHEGDTVQGLVTVTLSASDDRGVDQVVIEVNNAVQTTLYASPWTWDWDTTGLDGGPYTLKATAYDAAGNHQSAEVGVTVQGACGAEGDCPPSSVNFITPVDGATVCGTIALEAAATDDQGVVKIVFYADNAMIGTDSSSPFQVNWDAGAATEGAHLLKAEAWDAKNQTAFAQVSVTVANVGGTCVKKPTVSISKPEVQGDAAYVTGLVSVEAKASDEEGVTKVQFFVDNGLLFEDASIPYKFDWNSGDFDEGAHTLKAIAHNVADETASDQIAVTVDRTPPTVALTAPTYGEVFHDGWQLSADAEDNFGVASVVFEVSGAADVVLTEPPWAAWYDASGVASGDHEIIVTVTDRAGLTATDGTTVTLDRLPQAQFTAPSAGQIVTGEYTVKVTATDDLGAVQGVDLYVDDAWVGSFTGQGDYNDFDEAGQGTYEWTPPFVFGEHTLRAEAHDSGNQTTSAERMVTVDWPLALKVSACPISGDCVAVVDSGPFGDAHGAYTLNVTATDDNGPVQSVELKVDGVSVAADQAAPFELALDSSLLTDGPHVLMVHAVGTGASVGDLTATLAVNNCDRDLDTYLAIGGACGGSDCDDALAARHPNADDTVGDGIDENCDGADGVDADGDGRASIASGGNDCNDADPAVPNCAGKTCDQDTGCGTLCGCTDGLVCEDQACVCKPTCDGKNCGDDGCGGTCGACTGDETCNGVGQCVVDTAGITWVTLSGGTYQMGSDSGYSAEQPVHAVTLSGFEMAKSETTVAQYAACVTAGGCTAAGTWHSTCNWGVAGKEQHPVNCVDWYQSQAFCTWAGARLCTEAEWEYAARSGGQNQTYPWGDAGATCDYAVMYGNGDYGCGTYSTWAACSKTAGNSTQGVCDLAGNVWEWVADWYDTYPSGAQTNPTGPASGSTRVLRGGGWYLAYAGDRRASFRSDAGPYDGGGNLGLRCCRSLN